MSEPKWHALPEPSWPSLTMMAEATSRGGLRSYMTSGSDREGNNNRRAPDGLGRPRE